MCNACETEDDLEGVDGAGAFGIVLVSASPFVALFDYIAAAFFLGVGALIVAVCAWIRYDHHKHKVRLKSSASCDEVDAAS